MKRIGTILHGALGDYYEQLCSIKIMKTSMPEAKWIGFFAVKERMDAMVHFDLSMLHEVYSAEEIERVDVDEFFQFQIKDIELTEDILDHLPDKIREKFDLNTNILPWHTIRSFDFTISGLSLELSETGKAYLPLCYSLNKVTEELLNSKFTVGFLWRYRSKGGAVNPLFQRSKEWILKTKSELFNELITKYNAHIIIAGMDKGEQPSGDILDAQKVAGVVNGEYKSKFTNDTFDTPSDHCTYLKGLGYAAEMEIMSRCDLLLLMPSGFSEPLWMRHCNKVLVMDPPPVYMAKIWRNRMPLFNNNKLAYAWFNTFTPHTKDNVITFLERNSLLQNHLVK